MKFVLITGYYSPYQSPGALRIESLKNSAENEGHDVTVVAPSYRWISQSESESAKVVRPVSVSREWGGFGFVRRFFIESLVSIKLLLAAKREFADVYFITTPLLPLLLFHWVIGGARMKVVDVRDLTWDYTAIAGRLFYLPLMMLKVWALKSLVKVDLITTVTAAQARNIEADLSVSGVAPRVMHVPNGVDDSALDVLSGVNHLTGTSDISNVDVAAKERRPVIRYAGTFGRAQGIEDLVKIAHHLPHIDFEFIGDGPTRKNVMALAETSGASNVATPGRIPRDRVLERISRSDALIFRLIPGFESAVPSKAYEFLASGKAVFYVGKSDDEAWSEISEFPSAYLVEHVSPESSASQVAALMESVSARCNTSAAMVRERFSRVKVMSSLVKKCEQVCANLK